MKVDLAPVAEASYGSNIQLSKPGRTIVLPYNILEIGAIRGQKSMVTYKIEVTELNFEV